MSKKNLQKMQNFKKIKDVAVHHIHVRYGDDLFTFYHHGECIDLLGLLQSIYSVLNKEESK